MKFITLLIIYSLGFSFSKKQEDQPFVNIQETEEWKEREEKGHKKPQLCQVLLTRNVFIMYHTNKTKNNEILDL